MKGFPIVLQFNGQTLEGRVLTLRLSPKIQDIPLVHKVILNGIDYGQVSCSDDCWVSDKIKDRQLVNAIGAYIHAWYE